MPIEFNNGQDQNVEQAAERNERPQRERQERQEQVQRSRRGNNDTMRSIRGSIGRKFSSGRTNESLEKLAQHANERFENWVGKDVASALVLDARAFDTHFSAIVVATTAVVEGTEKTLVLPIIFEDERNPLRPRQARRYGGVDVETVPVPSDVYDATYFDAVVKLLVSKGYPTDIVNVGHQIVPAAFSITEPANLDTVLGEVLVNLQSYSFYEAGDLSHTLTPNELSTEMEVIANIDYRSEQSADIVNQPIVAPITIELAEQAVKQTNTQVQSYNGQGGAARQLLEVTLAINFQYVEPERDSAKCFVPQIVVTGIQSSELMPSLELVLYGLSSTSIVLSAYRWTEAFLPAITRAAPHRDIGALAIDSPEEDDEEYGQPVDIFSPSFNDKKFQKYIGTLIEDYTMIAIDAPEQGVGAYLTESFYLAAAEYANEKDEDGNPIVGGVSRIIQAANNATDGEFDKFWDGSQIVSTQVTRIHNGFYLDEQNSPRDIREIDYLYLLNVSSERGSIDRAREFDESFQRGGPIGQRDRAAIIKEVTGDNATFTGYSRRVVLNPSFVDALARAFESVGLGINPNSIGNYNRGAGRRRLSQLGNFLAGADEFDNVYRGRGSRRDSGNQYSEGVSRFSRGNW